MAVPAKAIEHETHLPRRVVAGIVKMECPHRVRNRAPSHSRFVAKSNCVFLEYAVSRDVSDEIKVTVEEMRDILGMNVASANDADADRSRMFALDTHMITVD